MTDSEAADGPVAVHLDRHTCAGQRSCEDTAPGVFRFSKEKGYSEVITELVTDPVAVALVREAEELCPTQSIHLAE